MIDKSTKIKTGEKGDCTVLRPSLMCAVPLVIDRIYKGINENVSKQGPFMEKLLSFCYQYKSYYRQKGMQTPIMDALIFRKMRSLVSSDKIILIFEILFYLLRLAVFLFMWLSFRSEGGYVYFFPVVVSFHKHNVECFRYFADLREGIACCTILWYNMI